MLGKSIEHPWSAVWVRGRKAEVVVGAKIQAALDLASCHERPGGQARWKALESKTGMCAVCSNVPGGRKISSEHECSHCCHTPVCQQSAVH